MRTRNKTLLDRFFRCAALQMFFKLEMKEKPITINLQTISEIQQLITTYNECERSWTAFIYYKFCSKIHLSYEGQAFCNVNKILRFISCRYCSCS